MRQALTLSAWVVGLVAVFAFGFVTMVERIRPAPPLEIAAEAVAQAATAGTETALLER